ncbi:MAG TPA: hypothetical protein VN836_03150 [Verrucomicrobiae bacterium]|nr:hypothetical protein [Verrucomicrobiae bacterium]
MAAHITAASPGGPRYDASLTPEQRADISNGIWLCQFCAKLVDNDEKRFRAEHLRLWKTLAEQRQRDRIEGKFVAAADSLQPKLFESLHALLERVTSSVAFPSAALFEKNLTFFVKEEADLMSEIEAVLDGSGGERLALLVGNTATGKTVMACSLGRTFQSDGYHVFYLPLSTANRFFEVWDDLVAASTIGEVLFILEDCHLSPDVASSLYRRFASLPKNVACLLVGRPVDEEARRTHDQFSGDYIQELSARDRCYSLDETLSGKFGDKVLGITRKHKAAWEVAHKAELSIGDERKLAENVQGNLLYLQTALSFWTPHQPLSELNHPAILERIADRYLNPLNERERETLLTIATLGELEIKFQIPQGPKLLEIEVFARQLLGQQLGRDRVIERLRTIWIGLVKLCERVADLYETDALQACRQFVKRNAIENARRFLFIDGVQLSNRPSKSFDRGHVQRRRKSRFVKRAVKFLGDTPVYRKKLIESFRQRLEWSTCNLFRK